MPFSMQSVSTTRNSSMQHLQWSTLIASANSRRPKLEPPRFWLYVLFICEFCDLMVWNSRRCFQPTRYPVKETLSPASGMPYFKVVELSTRRCLERHSSSYPRHPCSVNVPRRIGNSHERAADFPESVIKCELVGIACKNIFVPARTIDRSAFPKKLATASPQKTLKSLDLRMLKSRHIGSITLGKDGSLPLTKKKLIPFRTQCH